MRLSGNCKIRCKLILLTTALVTAAHLSTGFFIAAHTDRALHNEQDHQASATAKNLARLCAAPLLDEDLLALRDLIRSTMEQGRFTRAMIIDNDGKVLMHNDIALVGYMVADHRFRLAAISATPLISPHYYDKTGDLIADVSAPVMVADKRIATVMISCSHQAISAAAADLRRHILTIMAIGIAAGIVCAVLLAAYITAPLRELIHSAGVIAEGTFTGVRLPAKGNDEIAILTRTFNKMIEKIERMVCTDLLTGVANRLMFQRRLTEEFSRSLRHQRPLALLMIDVDYFKAVNDLHGHQVGDSVLQEIASLLSRSVRAGDFVARYGGEEFAVIAPDTGAPTAAILAERIRHNVAEHPFPIKTAGAAPGLARLLNNPIHRLTVSVGVANLAEPIDSEDKLIETADLLLLAAKRDGRNRVSAAAGPATGATPPPGTEAQDRLFPTTS